MKVAARHYVRAMTGERFIVRIPSPPKRVLGIYSLVPSP